MFLHMMTRDFEFAKKFDIPIIQVIVSKDGTEIENLQKLTQKQTVSLSIQVTGTEESLLRLKEEAPEIIEEMGIGKKTDKLQAS